MGHSYKELIVWQKAKALAAAIYKATEEFPTSERYGLTGQLRRAAVSVASNIAEGQGRNTTGEFLQFLGHARGSLLELQTQLDISLELKFLSEAEFNNLEGLSGEVLGLLNLLMESLSGSARSRGAGM